MQPDRLPFFACLLWLLSIPLAIAAYLYLPSPPQLSPAEKAAADAAELKKRTAWIPKGFTTVNDEVAYKWSDPSSYTCDYGRCWQIEVVSKNGCDSLYAGIGFLSGNGTNVGYDIDFTSGLAPGQKAILQFNSFNDAAEKGRLNEINCH